jgi:hypothetical protein
MTVIRSALTEAFKRAIMNLRNDRAIPCALGICFPSTVSTELVFPYLISAETTLKEENCWKKS